MSRMAEHAAMVACGAGAVTRPAEEPMDIEDAPGSDEPWEAGLTHALADQAQELVESWRNGNRRHVLDELATETPQEAMTLTAMMVCLMAKTERAAFLGALIGRAEVAFRREEP